MKHNVTFMNNGQHVQYMNNKTYYADTDMSCAACLPSIRVTVPNLVALVCVRILTPQIVGAHPSRSHRAQADREEGD